MNSHWHIAKAELHLNLLDIFGTILLVFAAIQLITAIKVFKPLPRRAIWGMATFTLRGKKALIMLGGLFGLTSAAAAALFPEATAGWILPFPRFFQCGISLVALNAGCLPPAFLFLGASRQPAFNLLSEIPLAIAPLKLVHMIESIEAGSVIHEQIDSDDYRVRNDWRNAVRMVSELAPIILIDLRVLSRSVIDENSPYFIIWNAEQDVLYR